MIANYHTHTPRCRHAKGGEEEYAQSAVDRGLKILGFSDHSPYAFPAWFDSDYRMRLDQFNDYVDTVNRVKEIFRDRLEVHLGVEMEYYPAYLGETLELLRDRGVEYAILGQHFVGNEIDDHYNGYVTGSEELLERYVNQTSEAMETGLFTYLAHPDLFHFSGNPRHYQARMRKICQTANSCGMPLELNLLGLVGRRHYPNPFFWEVAAEENCRVILGYDAHDPAFLGNREIVREGLEFLKPYGLELLETVPLRPLGG